MREMTDTGGPPVLVLTVAYNGATLAGFASQPDQPTVQDTLAAALATLLKRPVKVVGAGRTDAGVHALGQVVSVALDSASEVPRDRATFMRSVNALVDPAVRVREVRLAAHGFSARFSATAREYRYLVATGQNAPLFTDRFAHHVPYELDLTAMRAGAAHLVGEHDFRSFCVVASAEGMRTVRTLERVDITEVTSTADLLGEPLIAITVKGNAFLHSMVRVIVGSLLKVGAGRHEPDWIADALAARDRVEAGPTAPACGLTLVSVTYPDDVWLAWPTAGA